MDSLTQIVLGGAVAAAIAPARHRRAALLAGAALGTLPDLDSLPILLLTDDPVALMTLLRGASHSLFVLPLLGWLLWAFFRRRGGRVAQSPKRWFWAIQAALLTHPVLDAFTVYGTQLLWPLPLRPVMWSSVFIIDPLYTVWLLLACVAAFFLRERVAAQRALAAGLVLSTAYLGWSLAAKAMVEREADRALAAIGLADAPRFSVPTPFNTLLWRVVAMTPDGYVEGFRSLVADEGAMRFQPHASDVAALAEAADIPAVARLAWFNHGFMRASEVDGELVLTDLRMGSEPDYSFNFAVAGHDGGRWHGIAPKQLSFSWDGAGGRLPMVWGRIFDPHVDLAADDCLSLSC
ncbi:metal-dependent hydrolase [Luteimonas terricola]|uniref:Membrane protein n=1 Tax=Luteimonas terricola TaxID=645597 RepID=A0ABQ2EKF3_9GAMM|nr:metal-dependent hydrolase [Luteimonas terricola]GGK12614.1 membrane protein [Luteimonas terricola]